jgi:hypothetical protein
MRADDVRRSGEQQRIAVGRRFGDEVRAYGAAGARLVLDEELPPELVRKPRRQHPRRRVGESARGERHDDAHRPRRIRLSDHRCASEQQRCRQQDSRGCFHQR